jgi:hypothetical protein
LIELRIDANFGLSWAKHKRFDDLKLPDETAFPNIKKLRRFTCSVCGSGRVSLMPDWRGQLAQGRGRQEGV